jgi:hypothetical protein
MRVGRDVKLSTANDGLVWKAKQAGPLQPVTFRRTRIDSLGLLATESQYCFSMGQALGVSSFANDLH